MIRAFTEGDAAFFTDREDFADGWTESMVLSTMKGEFFTGFVCEIDGAAVCAVIACTAADEADIECIYTLTEYRRRGLAKQVLEHALEKLRQAGISRVFLEVRADNAPALKLYESMGFTRAGERKRYYKDGQTAIVMVNAL